MLPVKRAMSFVAKVLLQRTVIQILLNMGQKAGGGKFSEERWIAFAQYNPLFPNHDRSYR